MHYLRFFILLFILLLASTGPAGAEEEEYFEDDWPAEEMATRIADPLEPVNRLFFQFNDKLYFWVLKPLGSGYGFVVPKPVRTKVANFFYNLKTPVRLVNNVLQGKVGRGGVELSRFMVNTTVGVGGLWDPARHWFDLAPAEEDFGQTLARYGAGAGIYICWPLLGPSNIRDTLGAGGDYFLNPVSYLGMNGESDTVLALRAGETVNGTSLRIGDYEDFKAASFDPYSAMRDAYLQRRRIQIAR
ncbi:MAG: VacJ family lipoprotein [Desulfurivibrionaceae bacterium]|nr:VacJ family lipoprotein [Desulfobulbales bacterium]MDT8334541.1 VacJ family lipoprotein [Desulfurivibrionaceae bacterium]